MRRRAALRYGPSLAIALALAIGRVTASPVLSLEAAVLDPPRDVEAVGCVYYDTGSGYSEARSACFRYRAGAPGVFRRYEVAVPARTAVRGLRFDPLPGAGAVRIRDVRWTRLGERRIPLAPAAGGPRPLHAVEVEPAGDGLDLRATGPDPYVLLTGDAGRLAPSWTELARTAGEALALLAAATAVGWLLGVLPAVVTAGLALALVAHLARWPVVRLEVAVREPPRRLADVRAALYYDTGSGFSEREVVRLEHEPPLDAPRTLRFTVPTWRSVERLRFDPLDSAGVVVLRRADLERWGTRPLELRTERPDGPSPLHATEIRTESEGAVLRATGDDPSILLADGLGRTTRPTAGELVRIARDAILAAALLLAGRAALGRLAALGGAGLAALRRRPAALRLFVEAAPPAIAAAAIAAKSALWTVSLPFLWIPVAEPVWRRLAAHPTVLAGSLAAALAIAAPVALLPVRPRLFASWAAGLAVSVLLLADELHVAAYGDVLSLRSLPEAELLPAVGRSLAAMLHLRHLGVFADAVVLAAVAAIVLRLRPSIRPAPAAARARVATVAALAGLVLAVPVLRLASAPDARLARGLEQGVAREIGLLAYHVLDLAAPSAAPADPDAVARRARDWFAGEYAAPRPRSPLFGAARGANLALVSAESLQAFPLHLEVRGRAVAPRLAAFAGEALEFTEFHDQTGVGTTADAAFLVLQSLHPLGAEPVAGRFADDRFRALPEILAERGWATLSLVGAPGSFWSMDRMHPRLGFRDNWFDDRFRYGESINEWIADRDFFAQTVPVLERQPEPFFAFLLSSSSHHPYRVPARYRTLELGDLEGTAVGDYLHAVHYFDLAFGEWLDRLSASGLLDRTMVAVYGDHHNLLGDRPETARLLGFRPDDGFAHLRVRKRVPFLVRLPGGRGAGRRATFGGHLDVAPTLLALFGIDAGPPMLGRDLTAEGEALVVFRDGSFTDGAHYFLNRFGPVEASLCYAVATGKRVGCAPLAPERRRAAERLEISDAIVRADRVAEIADVARPVRPDAAVESDGR